MRSTELIKFNLYQHKIYYINSTIIAYLIDVLIHAKCSGNCFEYVTNQLNPNQLTIQ